MTFRLFDAPQAEPSQFVGFAGNIIDRQSENRADDATEKALADPATRLHFYLLDALHYAPDPEKLATPWREAGRTDLTPERLHSRIESYVQALLDRLA